MLYRCREKHFFLETRCILQIYFHGIIETQRVCNHQILDFLLDFLIGEPANSVHTMSRKSRNSHIFGAKIPKFSKPQRGRVRFPYIWGGGPRCRGGRISSTKPPGHVCRGGMHGHPPCIRVVPGDGLSSWFVLPSNVIVVQIKLSNCFLQQKTILQCFYSCNSITIQS